MLLLMNDESRLPRWVGVVVDGRAQRCRAQKYGIRVAMALLLLLLLVMVLVLAPVVMVVRSGHDARIEMR